MRKSIPVRERQKCLLQVLHSQKFVGTGLLLRQLVADHRLVVLAVAPDSMRKGAALPIQDAREAKCANKASSALQRASSRASGPNTVP